MKKKLIITLLLIVYTTVVGLSQTKKAKSDTKELNSGHCATDNLHVSLNQQSSTYKKKFDEMNANYQKWAVERTSGNKQIGGNNSIQTYTNATLPVIFHMMVNTFSSSINPTASATDGNLTKTQIQTALGVLNQLFAATAVGSKSITGVNTDIQFCLAEVDNFGNAITSYTYTDPSFSLTLDNTNQPQITALSNIVQSTGKFPPTKYINVYVVENIASPVAGFAYMPPAHGSSFDGIYIEAQYLLAPTLPNDLAYNMTVLTHEMGHYLGMFHTFGICTNIFYACSCNNNNCLFDGDMVCDTPPDFSQSPTVGGCTTGTNTCNTDIATIGDALNLSADVNDLTNNYMDYGDWNCQYSFTQGQVNRMHFMIDDQVGPRNSLLNSSVCNTVCANASCTVNINPITTTSVTVSNIQLLNSLILSGPTVNYTFSGTICSPFYNAFNWSVVNLTTNTIIQTGSGITFPTTFTATGNYRIILTSSIAGSNPLCSQTTSLNIQVLPPVSCPNNLDMAGGWNTGNWERIKYEGGWSHTTNNSVTFTHPTTTLSILSGTVPNGTSFADPFSFTTTLAGDPNFSSVGLPFPGATIMRVGRVITPSTTLPAGDGNYVTYTFSPTNQNAKIRVYYLGMKEHDAVSPTAYMNNFASNAGAKSGFGFVCNHNFTSAFSPTVSMTRGLTHTGTGSYGNFNANDMVTDVINSPTTAPVTIGTSTFDAMGTWNYMDLDFSEFVCAAPTITITFFARADEASTAGILHSYAYFATQCLPSIEPHININLTNKDIACMADVGQSCVKQTLPPPNPYNFFQNGYSYYYGLMDISVQESNDGITYTTTSLPVSYQSNSFLNQYEPYLNLCKTPDAFPYKYFKITYKTLCQTTTNTVSIFQGFVHSINDCAPNPMSGGTFTAAPIPIGSVTISPDQYQQMCGTNTLVIGRPCWLAPTDPDPEYQWQIGTWSSIGGATLSTLPLSNPSYPCTPYRRLAKYNDPYCNVPTWIPSDVFYVTDLRYNYFSYTPSGPDVCGNTLATFSLTNFYDAFDFLCDKELAAQTATTPVTNTISFAFFSNASCSPSCALTPTSGPTVLTYTFMNSLTFASNIDLAFTFNNAGIYTSNGNIYGLVTVTRFGCTSTYTISNIPIKIKPSAIPGTIALSSTVCTSSNYTITGDNPNSTGYYWEYSYSSSFLPTFTLVASTNSILPVTPSTFTAFPVFVRRVANGTIVCPNVAYSNTLTINNTGASVTLTPSSSTICAGVTETLTASGSTTYTWSYGSTTTTVNPLIVTPSVTTIYTVTSGSLGCGDTKTVMITVNPTPTITSTPIPTVICSGACITTTLSGGITYTIVAPSFTTNSNPITICPTVTTIYTISATNSFGCIKTNTFTLMVLPSPIVTISPSSSTICAGMNATLTASGAPGYVWSSPTASTTVNPWVVTPTVSTTYTVLATAVNKCTDTETVSITVNPSPTLTGVASATICKGSSVSYTAGGATSYTWSSSTFTSTSNPIVLSPTITTTYTLTGINSFGCNAQQIFTITVIPMPTVTAVASSYTICAGQSSTLTGGGASTYTWVAPPSTSTSVNPLIVTPSVTTTYTLYGKGKGSSCIGSKTITITVKPSPTVSIVGSTVICFSDCTILNAPGGGSYSWSPSGATTSSICAGVGVNSVVVTGTNGCTATQTVNIIMGTTPTITATASLYTICAGNSTTLTATGGSSYTWTAASFSSTSNPVIVSPTVSTTYTVSGSKSGPCINTKTITITVLAKPNASITGVPTICSGCASLTATGGGTYLWSNGSTSSTVCINTSGVQTLTVTGTGGCTSTASITTMFGIVPSLTATASSATICSGSNVTLTGSGAATYTWTGPSFTSTSNPVVVNPTINTTYTLTGQLPGGCIGTKTITIYMKKVPVTAISGATASCGPFSSTLTASGTGSFLWSTGAFTPTISVSVSSPTTIFSVTLTAVSGCTAKASTTLYCYPIPSPTITGNTNVCAGSTTTLTSSSPGPFGSYLWNTGSTSASITTSLGGVYTVTLTNLFGCKGIKSVTVTIIPKPIVNITGGLQICPGQTTTLTATGGGTYSWSTGASTSTVVINTTGVKTVTVTGTNGCVTIKSVTITVPINCPHLPFEELGKITSLGLIPYVYPNPTKESFTVGNSSDIILVEIYDYTGKLLKRINKSENEEFSNIDLKTYVQGAYFIKVINSESTFTIFKLIKD